MTTFSADSNAAAVILADFGEVDFNSDYHLTFRRTRRIKLLRAAAYDTWGTVELTWYTRHGRERLEEVEGQTFNLSEDGKVERRKLEKDAIFREDVDENWKRARFTLPALKPGSVIEYRYTIISKEPGYLTGWTFQVAEPVRWSEYRARIPLELTYIAVVQGGHRFDIEESHTLARPNASHVRSNRWVMKDVPALRSEPYMTTLEDYRAKIRFQLAGYQFPGTQLIKVLESWERVAADLMEDAQFGRQISRHRDVRDLALELTRDLSAPEAKMVAVYEYLRWAMTLDKRTVWAHESLERVLRSRKGSASEIALLLTSMLRDVGLDANPVLISTRSHGQITRLWPMLQQFDHVIVHVNMESKEFLLDATDPWRPYYLLPFEALNGSGFLVNKTNPRWIRLETDRRSRHHAIVRAVLNPEGDIKGEVEISDHDYGALLERKALPTTDLKAHFERELLGNLPGARLGTYRVVQKDSIYYPLVVKATFSAPAYANVAGDYMYLNPVVLDRMESNPLQVPERTFPVDLGHPIEFTYALRLTLPDGFEVHERPPALNLQLPGKGGRLRRVVDARETEIEVLYQYSLDKARYEPISYRDLREFFNRIVAAHADQLVLKRKSQPTGEDAASTAYTGHLRGPFFTVRRKP